MRTLHLLATCLLLPGLFLPEALVAQHEYPQPAATHQVDTVSPIAGAGSFLLAGRAGLAEAGAGLDASPAMLPLDAGQEGRERKSGLLAILSSALLPGMGELYAGRFDRGRYPLIADAVLWLALAGVNVTGNWIQNDARTFAGHAAGVVASGKDEQFFVDIGNYMSLADYNAAKRIERAVDRLYPEDPAAGYAWEWRTSADRTTYRDQRIRADEFFNASGFVVLGLIANRIWSAVQSALLVRSHNAALEDTSGLPTMRTELLSAYGKTDGLRFVFTRTF